jgi:hypothetical protein
MQKKVAKRDAKDEKVTSVWILKEGEFTSQ